MKRMLSILLAAMLLCVAWRPWPPPARSRSRYLRVTWWGSQTRHDLTMAAIEKFEEKYPYITVEAEFTSWDGYWSKLATQVARRTDARRHPDGLPVSEPVCPERRAGRPDPLLRVRGHRW